MTSHALRRTLAAVFLAAALAVPAHALPERRPEPSGILSWLHELWSTVWEEVTGGEETAPEGQPPNDANGDEGHMIDPNG